VATPAEHAVKLGNAGWTSKLDSLPLWQHLHMDLNSNLALIRRHKNGKRTMAVGQTY